MSPICEIKAETEVSTQSVYTLQNDYQRECWVSLGFRRFQVEWNFKSLSPTVTPH
jgi:hypothetical protein